MTIRPTPKPLTVRCPSCRKETPYTTGNPARPFCSERCRSLDLGAWASERFRVEDPAALDDQDHPPRQ